MDGIIKVIDDLGLMILARDIELEKKQEEIDKLRTKIDTIEKYLEFYDTYYNQEFKAANT